MQLKAAIRNRAIAEGIPVRVVMQNYLLERLLERIACSPWRDCVVIKGGMLIASLIGVDKRSTKDLDATVRGFSLTHESVERAFRAIADVEVDDDFSFEFVRTEEIREADDYPGIRVRLRARYEKIASVVTVDVTTGDKITPGAIEFNYPLMFDDRTLSLMAYPLVTVVSEKLETVICRGTASTRLRDYYDLYELWSLRGDELDRSLLAEALVATAKRRGTLSLMGRYREVMADVSSDESMRARWAAYAVDYPYVGDLTLSDACAAVVALMESAGW